MANIGLVDSIIQQGVLVGNRNASSFFLLYCRPREDVTNKAGLHSYNMIPVQNPARCTCRVHFPANRPMPISEYGATASWCVDGQIPKELARGDEH
jgi:hypothetical protein